jgi:predicted RND superfamily exporter protein
MSTPDVVQWVTRGRHALLLLAAMLLIAALWLAPQLRFDRSVENMFPPDSPVLADYQQLKRTFGGNEIVLAVYQDPQLFASDGSGLARLRQLRQRMVDEVPGVKAVLSIDQPLPGDLILSDSPLAQRTRELFRGYTHGADQQTVSLVCMLFPPDENSVSRRLTIDKLREVMDRELPKELQPSWLTGEPILVTDGFRFVEQDGAKLGLWSMLLLGATIILCFRSLRWVIIPVAVVQFALLLTQAALVVAGIELSMVSSMLTAVVMVIGVATMVHLMVRFAELREEGLEQVDALRETFRQLLVPITWACLTDAVGFLALTVSEVGPVRDFGIMMAVGSVMVLVSVVLLVPGLAVFGRVDPDPHLPWGEGRLTGQLQRLLRLVRRRPRAILVGLVLLTVTAIAGLGLLDVETDFTRNFRQDSEIARSYQFVEDHLGGAGVCDIMLPAPETLDWDYLQRVHRLGQSIYGSDRPPSSDSSDLDAITKGFSLADAVVELSPVELSNKPALLQTSLVQTGLAAMRGWMPVFYDALYGTDPAEEKRYFRMMLRVTERQGADQKEKLIQELTKRSRAEFPEAEVTGYFVLLTQLINSVVRDQWRSFTVAIVGIGLLMTLAFRDLRLAVIALIPNAFPIMVVLGTMGWISWLYWPDLKINMGTAMIAAVSMGLSIDSSIHYILGFRRELQLGFAFDEALDRVQRRVGKALVLSTIALAVGFTVLATSNFIPTVYFGVLVTLAMLGGLAGNLIGLPLLLHAVYRK